MFAAASLEIGVRAEGMDSCSHAISSFVLLAMGMLAMGFAFLEPAVPRPRRKGLVFLHHLGWVGITRWLSWMGVTRWLGWAGGPFSHVKGIVVAFHIALEVSVELGAESAKGKRIPAVAVFTNG